MLLNFYNTQKIVNGNLSKYSLKDNSQFLQDIQSSTSIIIISAFYNREFFYAISKNIDNNTKVEVFMPAEKGINKAVRQRNELIEFSTIKSNFSFRLVESNYLLHTKLYLIENENSHICWIGSSNASTNSINNCEELMVRLSQEENYPIEINSYIHCLKQISSKVEHKKIAITSSNLYNFFDQGTLYTKATETFAPSIEIDFGEYNDKVIEKLKSANRDPLTELFIKTTNRISLLNLLKLYYKEKKMSTSEIDSDGKRFESIKKYGLFTV